MNQGYPQGGLASLLASQGRDEDKVLVHMTPGEVQGLQAIALASGGSLTVNPQTGLPEAGWLKNLIPAIAGGVLKSFFPNLGSVGSSALVGAATGLIEGSFDKGMRAGLTAYSGAKVSEGLRAAAVAARQAQEIPQIVGGMDELSAQNLMDTRRPIDLSKVKVEMPKIETTTKQPLGTDMWSGVKALLRPEGQSAFMKTIEGPYQSEKLRDLSRAAVFSGALNLFAEDPKKIPTNKNLSKPRYYVPGAVNPKYGQGYDEWYFQPGYYSDTYPGYAQGGMVGPGDERFANGGEVMVSPEAVIPQTLSVYNPQFTQDPEGLKAYYESLLVPPDTTPRDTSALQNYLDDLRNRLKKPYQPVSGGDWQYGDLPTPSPGGSTSPRAETGGPPNSGTPIDFNPPTSTPPPQVTPPPPAEDEVLTPPTNIGRPAMPEDLGPIVGTPPEFIFDVPEEEPEDTSSVGVEVVEDGVIREIPVSAGGTGIDQFLGAALPPPLLIPPTAPPEPEDTSSVGVEVDEDGMVREIPVSAGGTGIDQFLGAALPPPLLIPPTASPEPEDTSSVGVEVDEDGMVREIPVSAGGTGIDRFIGAGTPPPVSSLPSPPSSQPVYSVGVTPVNEQSASDEFRQQLYNDLGGKGAVPDIGFNLPIDKFAPPMSSSDIGDLSRPVVDQILRNFDAQQAAQPQEKGIFTKFLDLLEGTGGVTGAVVSTFREAVDQYKKGDLDAKKLLEEAAKGAFGEELVEEAKKALTPKEKEEAKEEAPKETVPPPSKSEGRGGSAIPWTTERNYTLRDLINPVERGGGQPKITTEEMLLDKSFAGGGRVRHFAQGGLGSLQQYAVGGKLVNGAGDGMSDDIKANINGTQEARLADGEFVIPADVVSHLGNGSTDAGAKQLYAMMDRIRKVRTGRERQAPEVNPRKYMPA
jgi:hypothetical protein